MVGLPFCAAGLYGAIKKRQKFVYAYFVYSGVYAVMSVFASIAFLAMASNGSMSKHFVDRCMNYPGQDYESCRDVSKAVLSATGAFTFILSIAQVRATLSRGNHNIPPQHFQIPLFLQANVNESRASGS